MHPQMPALECRQVAVAVQKVNAFRKGHGDMVNAALSMSLEIASTRRHL